MKTHCKNGHEFTAENTRKATSGARICRTCEREYQAQYQDRPDVKARRAAARAAAGRVPRDGRCRAGHWFTPENTVLRKNGTERACRACALRRSRKARGIVDEHDARARRQARGRAALAIIRAARLARHVEATERLWERYQAEGRVIYNNHVRRAVCASGHPLIKANVCLRLDRRRDRVVAQCRDCKNRRERGRKLRLTGTADIFALLSGLQAEKPLTPKEKDRQRIQAALQKYKSS